MCNFPEADQKILDSIVPRKQGIKILEVGSWTGTSTCVLGKIAKECGGFVMAVDHWKGSPNTWMQCEAYHKDIFSEFQKNIKEFDRFIFPIISDSMEAMKMFNNYAFDAVFIDGDHEYEAVKNDLLYWQNKITPGGMLCGHDCGTTWPGVKKALDEVFGKTYQVIDNSTIWLRKF